MTSKISSAKNNQQNIQQVSKADLANAVQDVDANLLDEFSMLLGQIAASFDSMTQADSATIATKVKDNSSSGKASVSLKVTSSKDKKSKSDDNSDSADTDTIENTPSSADTAEKAESNESVESCEADEQDQGASADNTDKAASQKDQRSVDDTAVAAAASQTVKSDKPADDEAEEKAEVEGDEEVAEQSVESVPSSTDGEQADSKQLMEQMQTLESTDSEEQPLVDELPQGGEEDAADSEASEEDAEVDSETLEQAESLPLPGVADEASESSIKLPQLEAAGDKIQKLASEAKPQTMAAQTQQGENTQVTAADPQEMMAEQRISALLQQTSSSDSELKNVAESSATTSASAKVSELASKLAQTSVNRQDSLAEFTAQSAVFADYQSPLMTQVIKPVLEVAASRTVTSEAQSVQQTVGHVQQATQALDSVHEYAKTVESSIKQDSSKATKNTQRVPVSTTIEKVEAVLKEAAKSRDGTTISLRLDPPSLGSVKVDVTLRDGTLHARIVAETPAVNSVLREKAHELQAVLRKAGVEADRVSVSVGSDGSASSSFDTSFADSSSSNGSGKRESEATTSDGNSTMASAFGGMSGQATETVLDHWVA